MIDWKSQPKKLLQKVAEHDALKSALKKKPKHATHATARSLKRLRDNGWIAWIVEKWIPPRGTMKFGVRQDVWGFGDILACRPRIYETCDHCYGTGKVKYFDSVINKFFDLSCIKCRASGKIIKVESGTALVQCFPNTGGQFAAHRAKILAIPEHKIFLASGDQNLILLHGWAKQGPRGRAKRWTLRQEVL